MEKSAREKSKLYDDPVKKKEHKPAGSERQAYKDEHTRLKNDVGPTSKTNYNKNESPGKKYKQEDKPKDKKEDKRK
jgi:hypothetical protein